MFESDSFSPKTLIVGALSFVALTVLMTLAILAIGPERLRATVASAGALAPVLYVGIRALTYVVAPLSSGPLGFSSGVLFGLWDGILYTLIGEVIGGSANFWIARTLGRPVVARFVGRDGMGKVEAFYRQAGTPLMLAFARLFLFAIYDFVSYAAGLTSLRYRHYLLVTVIVGFVPAFATVAIGDSMTGDPARLVVMYIGLALLSAFAFLSYGRVRRLLKLDAPPAAETTNR